MLKFKAAVLNQIDKPLDIEELSIDNLEFGQVLVKVLVSGLCGAQLQEISGLKGNANYLPHLLGHEGCGIVVETGKFVTKVKPGDKVVMHWKKGSGIEAPFPKYKSSNRTIGGGKVTTLSQYSVVSENRLTKVENSTPNEFCALLGCGLSTALGTINYEANLKFGESILILGCGGLGLNLIQSAKLAGSFPIYSFDIKDKKNICLKLGATYYSQSLENLSNLSFDIIIDTTGNPEVIKNSIPMLGDNGRYIFVGQNTSNLPLELHNSNHLFGNHGKCIKATQGGNINPDKDIKNYSKLYMNSMIDYHSIITDKFDLTEINKAVELMKNGNAGRIIINCEEKI